MELESKWFYETAERKAADAGVRQLLGDLAEEERKHALLAEGLKNAEQSSGARWKKKPRSRSRLFLLQVIQPGLAGLMDGSVSTLAPLFAAAFATHNSWQTFWLAWLPAWGPASAWVSPKPSRMTAASRAGVGRGLAASSAAS